MPKVVFQIEGGKPVTVDCNVGDNLLELARRANVAIDAPWSGNGSWRFYLHGNSGSHDGFSQV